MLTTFIGLAALAAALGFIAFVVWLVVAVARLRWIARGEPDANGDPELDAGVAEQRSNEATKQRLVPVVLCPHCDVGWWDGAVWRPVSDYQTLPAGSYFAGLRPCPFCRPARQEGAPA